MKSFLCLTVATVSVATQTRVTPVEKVTQLMKELVDQVQKEGKAESKAYDEFACFCKEKTMGLGTVITETKEEVDILSASIESFTKDKAVALDELEERKKQQEKNEADLEETDARLAKEQAEYDYDNADLQKAVSSLQGALTALEDAKPTPAALIALRRVVKIGAVESALKKMTNPGALSIHALLQSGVDPNSPEYKYHSQGILDTLSNLHDEFSEKLRELGLEWSKAKETMDETIAGLKDAISNNKNAMQDLDRSVEKLAEDIAADREALVMDMALLKDDKIYLRDLTERCEARANDWDQRSQMRAGELEALSGALDILENKVAERDVAVNKRAFVQTGAVAPAPKAPKASSAPSSFVQVHSHNAHNLALSQQQVQSKVVDMLSKESQRLGSQSLSVLTMKITADPFAKVKGLIQDLIERLLQESTSEATKQGYCNTELGKAKKDRDFRLKDVMRLSTEVKDLELKKDELEAEIEELDKAIEGLEEDLKEAKDMRVKEHSQNVMDIKTAKEGLEAVTEATVIIKTYYKQAAKAIALVQASPVDMDTSGPGFEGNYGGKQQASQGIIGMLEVIKTDFERTISQTKKSEEKAQAEFVEFDRASKTDISAKTTKLELDREDLKTTKTAIEEKMSDLSNAQGLLDASLKKLTALKPMCTDFGQSWDDRKDKRQEEIDALKKAICMLAPADPDVEPQCEFA